MDSGNIDVVYELMDGSNDEVYYSLAIFLSLEDAIAKVKEGFDNPDYDPPNCGYYDDDQVDLIIRVREIGKFDEGGKEIWKGTFTNDGYLMAFFKDDELNRLAAIAASLDNWKSKSRLTGEMGEKVWIWECRRAATLVSSSDGSVAMMYPSTYKDYELVEGFNDPQNKAEFKQALVDSITSFESRYGLLFDLLFKQGEKDGK